MGSQRVVKQLKHNDSSKYLSESRSVSKDVRSTLTCISEEEAIQEGKTEKVEGELQSTQNVYILFSFCLEMDQNISKQQICDHKQSKQNIKKFPK